MLVLELLDFLCMAPLRFFKLARQVAVYPLGLVRDLQLQLLLEVQLSATDKAE